MAKQDLLVSAVAILRDHAAVLAEFVRDLAGVLESRYSNFEILLIDNGSTDDTPRVVREILSRIACVRYLRLTRPVEDETAITAGLDSAIGDYVVTLNPDFDPTAEIPTMVEACRGGHDLVLGVDRHPTKPGLLYSALRKGFRRLSRAIVRLDSVPDTTGYRVLSRQAVNALVKVRMRRRYFAVIAADIGLGYVTHPYDRISRSGRKPGRSLLRALRIGLSVVIHNSIVPLRAASALGLLGSLLSFLYSVYAVVVYLIKPDVASGWTTISLATSGLFGIAFLILALMGEYLGRLLEETSERPLYHVRDEQSSAVMLTEIERRNVMDLTVDPAPGAGR